MKKQAGQILIIIAVLLVVVLMVMAVIIDSGRLLIERQELNRASAAGGKSGMIYIGDLMVTQAAESYQATTLARGTVTPGPSVTPGSVTRETEQVRLEDNLSDQDRSLLISSPVRTQVAWEVIEHLRLNGYQEEKEGIISIEVFYPLEYQLENDDLKILVRISKEIPVLFSGFVPVENGVITGESRQSILQR